MNGKQHLTAGVTLAALDVMAYKNMLDWSEPSLHEKIVEFGDYMVPNIPYGVAGGVLFLLGLVLPDCDHDKSLIGRIFYVPLEHRTWTHTLWFVLLFGIIGLFFRPFLWLSFGYFLHLFCDSFSRCGVCWLYPITRYKHYAGAKIKRGHFLYFYGGGATDPLAWVLCGVLITITGLYCIGSFDVIKPVTNLVSSIDTSVENFVTSIWTFFRA